MREPFLGTTEYTYEGLIQVWNAGLVDELTVNGGDIFNTGNIDQATVNGGQINNIGDWGGQSGQINDLTVNAGLIMNYGGLIANFATINQVTVNGGMINNYFGMIDQVTVNDGEIRNFDYATIGHVIVNGGEVRSFGTIDIAMINGGTMTNASRINELTYVVGTYIRLVRNPRFAIWPKRGFRTSLMRIVSDGYRIPDVTIRLRTIRSVSRQNRRKW